MEMCLIPDCADSSIGGENDDGRQRAFERPIQKSKALDIEHVNLINK